MINFSVVFSVIGYLLCAIACAETLPAFIELIVFKTADWVPFISASVFTAFFGFFMIFVNRSADKAIIRVREAFLLTGLAWIFCSVFASIPFYWSSLNLSFTDSIFEAVASITTTGASVTPTAEFLPHGIIFWRSILQWIGGIGIIVMAMTIFPILRVGGMQLFRSEFSDHSDKVLPKISQIATVILATYMLFTLICAVLLFLAGMGWFDAICYGMSALSTSGFAIAGDSMGMDQNYWIELIIFIFMLLGGTTLMFFVRLSRSGVSALKNDKQVQWYFIFSFFAGIVLSLHLWLDQTTQLSWLQALRHGLFMAVSTITSSGFVQSDYMFWTPFSLTFLFMLSFIGGCTGSTAGGIKILRFYILFKMAAAHLRQLRFPHGVFVPVYQGHRLNETVATSVYTFLILYCITLILTACFFSWMGLDFTVALSSAAGFLGNIGQGYSSNPGLFAAFALTSPIVKWVCILIMILGRLELLTLIILLMPSFWKE